MSSPSVRQDAEIIVNHETLRRALSFVLVPQIFAKFRCGVNVLWKPRLLAFMAVLWVWSDQETLRKRFVTARKLVIKLFRWQHEPGTSYQGFTKALSKWSLTLLEVIVGRLRWLMQECSGGFWSVAGWVLFAVDGSRMELPRTTANEERFSKSKRKKTPKRVTRKKAPRTRKKARKPIARCAKRKGRSSKSKTAKQPSGPQMWLTLLWHVGLGLPWTWQSGPADSSEREHLLRMLGVLPENSMIVADPGFVGYEYWKAIVDADHAFLIRVGSNVRLLKRLGYARQYASRVYLWPDKFRKKGQPPLVLRLIELHTGKHPMYLVTNVLNAKQLNDRQARQIYKARWGIELFFRSFKQTFGRRKLRSGSPDNAQLELDWSLVGLWMICLLAVKELIACGELPERLSVASTLDAVRSVMRDYRTRPDLGEDLWTLMRQAITDAYTRKGSKASRNYPRKKNERPAGKPIITNANAVQKAAAKELKATRQTTQLTA